MKRDSSPPEAIRASGPNGAPGLVATSKCTRSQPCSPHSASASGVSTVRNRALSRRSGFSSAATAASSRRGGALARLRDADSAAAMKRRARLGGSRSPSARHPRRRPRSSPSRSAISSRSTGRSATVTSMLAGERAQREQPLLDLLELARVEFERARRAGRARPAPRRFPRRRARPPRQRRSSRPWARSRGALEPAQRAGERRLRAALAVDLADRLVKASPSRSAFCSRVRRAASRSSSSPSGASASSSASWWRSRSSSARLAASSRAASAAALARRAPVLPGRGERGRGRRMLGEGVEQRAVRRRVEQAALLALALDLDQAVAELAQQRRRSPARR